MSALERGIGRLCICRVDIEIVWQWCCALRTLLLRFSGHSKLWVVMPMNCVAGVLPTYPCPSGLITPVTAVRSANECLLGAVKRGLFCCRGTTHSIIGHRYNFALTLFVNANMSSDKHVIVVCYVLKCSKSRQRGNMQAVLRYHLQACVDWLPRKGRQGSHLARAIRLEAFMICTSTMSVLQIVMVMRFLGF